MGDTGGRDVRIDTPMLSGALAALTALATGVALTVVPALIAELGAQQSSLGVLGAILLALDALVLGHGGSLVLQAGSVTGAIALTPFGLTIVLLVVIALATRRAVRRLRPITADGSLRSRALRDGGVCLAGLVVVYTAGLGVLAGVARSSLVHAVVPSAIVSGALISLVGGLAGALLALRRRGSDGVPPVRLLELLPAPYGSVARALAIALAGLVAAAALVTVVMLVVKIGPVASIHASLHPGLLGSVVLLLLQLALLPLLMTWVLVVLLGGSVTLGAGSAIGLGGTETTVMPALPLLGIVPSPGDGPWWAWTLLVLPVAAVALGAVRLTRDLEDATDRQRLLALIAYPVVLVVLLLVLAGLATGGIGDGALGTVGPEVGSMLLPLLAIAVLTTAAVVGICATPALPWLRALVSSLRGRVEAAESQEAGGTSGSSRDDRGVRDARGQQGVTGARDARDQRDAQDAGDTGGTAERGALRSPSDPPSS